MLTLITLPAWWPFAVGGAVLLVAFVAIGMARARKRREALARVAQEIGFSFAGRKWGPSGLSRDLNTALFRKGNSAKTFQNIMTGSSAGMSASLFDYEYTISDGRHAHTTSQTVAAFSKNGITLPEFELRPEGIMQKVGDTLFHMNIRFESHPDFSRRFHLRGSDEPGTRELFTPVLLSFLESQDRQKKWCIEGMGQTLILYRAGKRAAPDEWKPFLDETSLLAGSFFNAAGVRRSGL